MSFVFAIFAPAHHHPRLSRIIFQNVIYVKSGFQHFSSGLLGRYTGVRLFGPQKTSALILLSAWTELKVIL